MRTIVVLLFTALLLACVQEVPTPREPQPATPGEITSFDECVAAGYPVMESYPRQCRTPGGEVFVEQITMDTDPADAE